MTRSNPTGYQSSMPDEDQCLHPHVRLVYNLSDLLPILKQAGELDAERRWIVLDQARQRDIDPANPKAALDLLLGLKLTRAVAERFVLTT